MASRRAPATDTASSNAPANAIASGTTRTETASTTTTPGSLAYFVVRALNHPDTSSVLLNARDHRQLSMTSRREARRDPEKGKIRASHDCPVLRRPAPNAVH